MKKSLIAMAVTGAVVAPMAASAASAEVYGRVDIGLETTTDPTSAFLFPGFNSNKNQEDDESDFELQNGNQSRIGFTGSEDLGNGWTASAKIELEAFVLSDNSNDGGDEASGLGETRVGTVSLAKGQHSITIGKQWQPAFEYMGWNQGRLPTHGYASYFKIMSYMLDAGTVGAGSSGATGYRQDSSIGYQFGGGGYSKDPFTVDVLLGVNNGGEPAANQGIQNNDGISSIQVFAAGTFGPDITINGGFVQDFRDLKTEPAGGEVEPSLFSVGGRLPIGDSGFEIGTSFYRVETDTAGDDEVDAFALTGFWTGSNGWSAQLGYGTVDADEDTATSGRIGGFNFGANQTEVDSFNFGVTKALSSRTHVRLTGEFADVDQALNSDGTTNEVGEDIDGGVVMLGIQHNF